MSSSPPRDIPSSHPSSSSRRPSLLTHLLPDSLTRPPLYLSTSPIAREILQSDLQPSPSSSPSPSDNDNDNDNDSDSSSTFSADHLTAEDAKLAFHPNGVTYGLGFSIIPLPGLDRPVPNPREVEESFRAEVELLRDNELLPPSRKDRHGSVVERVLHILNVEDVGVGHGQDEETYEEVDEGTALLRGDGPGDGGYGDGMETPLPKDVHRLWEEAVAARRLETTWQREAGTLVGYAVPLVVTFLLHYSVTIGSVLAVGRLGKLELGAVNLATMTASITCYVPVQGLATCLDTLCSIAYGSGNKHLVGIQAQRMTVLLWTVMVPIAVVWLFSQPILEALVPDKHTAALAALYLRYLILGMPGVAAFESCKRYVGSQGLFHITTYALLVGAPLSFLMNWVFVFVLGWSFKGSALAMAITQNLLPLLVVGYVWLGEGRECWGGLNLRKAFKNWGPMIKLALPGMIMIEAQFSVLEILTIAAGQFGTAKLAAQSILVTVTSTSFNIPFPLAIATSTRVANMIGAGLSDAARVTAKVAVIAACIVGTVNLSIFVFLRRQIAGVFTPDAEVIDIAAQVMLVCALMQIFDSLAAVSHGILRGVGRQAIGGYANLFAYYLVALPIGLSTAFVLGWELKGLWVGLTGGLAAVSAIELMYLYHANWDSAVAQARSIMRAEDGAGELKGN